MKVKDFMAVSTNAMSDHYVYIGDEKINLYYVCYGMSKEKKEIIYNYEIDFLYFYEDHGQYYIELHCKENKEDE